ncbi:MAG: 30S ribosomal protein S9 [candidate division Zixibacteria bacterium]|nr:30S ribosomal protein S9 [candidate division Zixibacteria bacterium]
MPEVLASTVGRRKTSTMRIWLSAGSGIIKVNGRMLAEYLGKRQSLIMSVFTPLEVTGNMGKYDIRAKANGGGVASQAEALRLALSRALAVLNPDVRKTLRTNGLLTRDSRKVERKKYGLVKARKRYQYSKR